MMPTNASGVFEPQTAYSFRMTYPPQSDVELKLCPFCGSKNVRVNYNSGHIWVECVDCGCNGPRSFENREWAIEKWNRRVKE